MNKVAILIDGGYFLKRLPSVRSDVVPDDVESVIRSIRQLVHKHLQRINDERLRGKNTENPESPYNLLHRCFYYDARPYKKKHHTVKLKQAIDYAKSKEAVFRESLFRALTKERSFALRLGRVQLDHPWLLKKKTQEQLLDGTKSIDDLSDDDFFMGFKQKGVDMRIGVDIAHMTMKKQVDTIILVAGDADFVPAAKLARREGVKIILDPLWHRIGDDLYEHIDELHSCFSKPERKA